MLVSPNQEDNSSTNITTKLIANPYSSSFQPINKHQNQLGQADFLYCLNGEAFTERFMPVDQLSSLFMVTLW